MAIARARPISQKLLSEEAREGDAPNRTFGAKILSRPLSSLAIVKCSTNIVRYSVYFRLQTLI